MNSKVKKAFALIGPYPYNPLLILAFFSACYFSRFIPVITQQPRGLERYIAAITVIALAVLPSIGFAILAYLIQRFRKWSSTNLLYYILEVLVGQSLLFILAPFIKSFLASHYNFEYEAPLTLSPGLYFGSLVLIMACLALLHRAELSIIKRLERADRLTSQLQKDREELIFSDEELRKQTSQFLHDRVQSDLMVVAMKLKSIKGDMSAENRSILNKSIGRLESIRSSDLRNLIQILSPNFAGGGLSDALELIQVQYQSSIDVHIELSLDLAVLSENQNLGIFRITEQSLLNSLVHGPASKVTITLSNEALNGVMLVISDDGPGVDISIVKPGVGSAIIDSWVNILRAQKEIETSPGNGFRLKVRIPTN